ncbi:MAG: recombinase family protein [Deltaproteobacteria bacterium]|nr:recombinase family protein [Deltaproteobacteria bacterium]
MKEKLKLVGYARVSGAEQRDADTIRIQTKALRGYCEKHGHELVQIFKDNGVSGALEKRPGLAQLFAYLEEAPEVDGVLVYKLDRLARDLLVQEFTIKKLEALGRRLYSVTEPALDSTEPMRKAFRQFMGIVAELEKAFITMRLLAGRMAKIEAGGYAGGGAAFGYVAKDGELVVDEEKAKTIRQIFSMKRRGVSLNKIARTLNERGVPTARGGKWYACTVSYILKNKRYRGLLEYGGVKVKNERLNILRRREGRANGNA